MKSQISIGAIAVATATTPVVMQHHTLADLQGEHERLQQQVQPLAGLRAEHEQVRTDWLAAQELDRLQKQHQELVALRKEAQSLRETRAETKLELQSELAAARFKFEAAQAQAEQARAEVEFKRDRDNTVNAMKHLGLAARIWATDNQDRFPSSFANLTNELSGSGEFSYDPKTKQLTGEFPGGIDLDRFEWVPHARIVSEMEPQLALFREKQPRRRPDDKWVRSYTLCDGSVQTFVSDTSDFSEWDEKLTATDPEIPEHFAGHPVYQPADSEP